MVNGSLGEVVGKVYVKRHFPPEAKARMVELVKNLGAAYGQGIDGLEWMGDETKVAAKAKLDKFVAKIGYPDSWEDYSKLDIEAGDLVGNSDACESVQLRAVPGPSRRTDPEVDLGDPAADRERRLHPDPERDHLPGGDPAAARSSTWRRTMRSTTAPSAWSSATRWATPSTTRAASTTRRQHQELVDRSGPGRVHEADAAFDRPVRELPGL